MRLLEELWYGNFAPMERLGLRESARNGLLAKVVKCQDALDATLSEEQKELFHRFDDALNDMYCEHEKNAFEEGARFALRLAIETMNYGKEGN